MATLSTRVTARHIVPSFNLRDRPEKFDDEDNRNFISNLFPDTITLTKMEPFLLFGMRTLPPKPWPRTVAGLVAYFYIETSTNGPRRDHNPLPLGVAARPTNRSIASALDGRDTQDWRPIFEAVREDFQVQKVEITEVIYWWTYITIVLQDREIDYTKLPRRVGNLVCRYLFEDQMGRSSPLRARRITQPSPGRLGAFRSSRTLRVADPVWVDAPDTGAIEGQFITRSFQAISSDDSLEREKVWIQTDWVYLGQASGDNLPAGIRGSVILSGNAETLDVVGIFRYAPQGGVMAGYCNGIAADELIDRGYTLVG